MNPIRLWLENLLNKRVHDIREDILLANKRAKQNAKIARRKKIKEKLERKKRKAHQSEMRRRREGLTIKYQRED